MPFEPINSSTDQSTARAGKEKKNSPFVKLVEGSDPILRVIDEQRFSYWSYWFDVNINGSKAGRSLIVGYDNPLTDFMKSLGEGHPQYRKPTKRFRFNVLDRTPDDRGNPLNEIKIFDCSKTILNNLNMQSSKRRRRFDNQLGSVLDFDFIFITSGSGTKKETTVGYYGEDPIAPELLMLPRYDIETLSSPISNEALEAILNGEDYNEVMKSLGRTGEYPMINP